MLKKTKRFKPLWRIHNAVYHELVKGFVRERRQRYIQKIGKILRARKNTKKNQR